MTFKISSIVSEENFFHLIVNHIGLMRAIGSTTKDIRTNSKSAYLPVYDKIPEFDFSIDEIVSFAIIRSKFHEDLKAFSEMASINDESKGVDAVRSLFIRYYIPLASVKNYPPMNITTVPESIYNSYKQDQIDFNEFYSLLLISLRDEDMQKSFIQGECTIFRYRLLDCGEIKISDLPSQVLQQTDIDFNNYLSGSEFKIPFEHIFPYIDVTRCNLKNGYVTLAFKDLLLIFVSLYRKYLEKSFATLKKQKVNQTEIFKVITAMYDEQLGAFFTHERTNWNAVSIGDLDSLAHRSFPPCMYNMYTKLKSSHKLFHTGRLQLGLFLKGIGLSLNDSLKLWGDEFSKFGLSLDQFERQYAYNIRYNYGKEGSCRNFSPYSCMGMIRMPAPAIGQTHGCPFMQMRKEDCQAILERMFRDSKKHQSVAFREKCSALAEKGQKHAQIACTQLFNYLHDQPYEESAIHHPCYYFNFSEEQYREKEKGKK